MASPLPMPYKEIISRLGPLKNELMVFGILVGVILNGSAAGLEIGSPSSLERITAGIMHLSSVLFFLIILVFYCYAFFHLPGSAQEEVFTMHARELISEHGQQIESR